FIAEGAEEAERREEGSALFALSAVNVSSERLAEVRRQVGTAAGPLGEVASKRILQAYGMPVVPEAQVSSLTEALRAATRFGFPVALKTAAGPAQPPVLHKNKVDGVRLHLGDAAAVVSAYQDLAERLGPHVIVQPMID